MPGFHARGLLGGVLVGAIAGLISALVDGHVQVIWVILAVFVVFVANLVIGLVRRLQTTYTVTSERPTIERGLMTRELHQTRLERVQNVPLRQSLIQRALIVGTVEVHTAARARDDLPVAGGARPRTIARTVHRAR